MTNRHGQPVIAIDGTSASGKSTLGENLKKTYGAVLLEYGLFARLVGAHMLEQGFVPPHPPTAIQVAEAARYARHLTIPTVELIKRDVETMNYLQGSYVSGAVGYFAGQPEVMRAIDKTFVSLIDASREKPVIADGRTIGSFVYPNADAKLYIDADLAIRGVRRAEGQRERGESISDAEATEKLRQRDALDQNRTEQSTKFVEGLHTRIDTSGNDVEKTKAEAEAIVEAACPKLATIRAQREKGRGASAV